jgi:hypothetical protein
MKLSQATIKAAARARPLMSKTVRIMGSPVTPPADASAIAEHEDEKRAACEAAPSFYFSCCDNQALESSDKPMMNAFARVAPSLRFKVLAIRAACVLFRARDFKVLTCSGVHGRRFVAFLAI